MRIGIIGLGTIGKFHLDVIKDTNATIVSLCDIDNNTLDSLNLSNDITLYTDYKEMLLKENLDVVHICTPHHLHAEMIIFALENDVNVLCEKPLCINQMELDRILSVEKESSAKLGVVLQNRYNDSYVFLKNYLNNEKILSAHGDLFWHRDKSYYQQAQWRGKWQTEGGGVLINQAIHTLDLLYDLCGMPKKVSGHIYNHTLRDVIEVEDTASAWFIGDVSFNIYATNSSSHDYLPIIQLKTEQDLILLTSEYIVINGTVHNFKNSCTNGKKHYGGSHMKLIESFYSALENNVPFKLNGYEGSRALELVFKVYQSNGEVIDINPSE